MNKNACLVKCKNKRVNLAPGLVFGQESVELSLNRFTNIYWTEIDNSKFGYELVYYNKPRPLNKFKISDKRMVSAINFGNYFLYSEIVANTYPYNLCVNKGAVVQFPSNYRTWITTKNGKVEVEKTEAIGKVMIENSEFSWRGSDGDILTKTDLVAYGLFDIDMCKYINDQGYSDRKIISETNKVFCGDNELLIGIECTNNGPFVSMISNSEIDLIKVAFVLKGNRKMLSNLKLGSKILSMGIGNKFFDNMTSACSGNFSLGHTKKELIENLYKELDYKNGGIPKPLQNSYLKSWSVVLFLKNNKTVFFINDARPGVIGEEGTNVFELQELLMKRFDYDWAVVGDSGQSSKLKVGDEIYGNLHYQNYLGKKPFWDGKNGRSIPVALMAYEY